MISDILLVVVRVQDLIPLLHGSAAGSCFGFRRGERRKRKTAARHEQGKEESQRS